MIWTLIRASWAIILATIVAVYMLARGNQAGLLVLGWLIGLGQAAWYMRRLHCLQPHPQVRPDSSGRLRCVACGHRPA